MSERPSFFACPVCRVAITRPLLPLPADQAICLEDGVFREVLSGFCVAILALYGFQIAFSGGSATIVNQHPWVGYVILISAIVVASRVRAARKAGV